MNQTKPDLATLELNYEGFRRLATDQRLGPQERIGFPPAYRDGFEAAIFDDILSKLPRLATDSGLQVVDIGPGCAGLPRLLIDLCRERGHQLLLIDSPEMLAQLPDVPNVIAKCPGLFPRNADAVMRLMGRPADTILCYSVLHYIYVDCNLFDFIDTTVSLLAPDGRALIGDIPNHSKRRRFFSTERGQAFHRSFTGSDQPYVVPYDVPAPGKIDDAVLIGLMQRAQAAGCDAYLLPQGAALPMANRRDDMLLTRP
jgi:hypothetical protein